MDPRYAFYIWASFGLTALVVLWNVLAPQWQRQQQRLRLSAARDDESATSGSHPHD